MQDHISREAAAMMIAHPGDTEGRTAYRMGYRTGRHGLPASDTSTAASPEYRRGLSRGRRCREVIGTLDQLMGEYDD